MPHWSEQEELIPCKSPRLLSENVSARTLKAWHHNGLYSKRSKARVKLEAVYRGQMLYTSRERVLAFYRRLNGIKV